MTINMIFAQDLNGVIGDGENLLWYLSEDLQYFKELTLNKPIIMGRKTFESFPKLLPKRRHIVLTKNTINNKNVSIVKNINEALKIAKSLDSDVWIIGGGSIYQQTEDLVDKVYRTIVDIKSITKTPVLAPSLKNFEIVSDSGWLESKNNLKWKKQVLSKI